MAARMVNHACNLRCTYGYTGAKVQRPMPEAIGTMAIDRALGSLAPGGTLQLGFFGGEPLVEARLVRRLIVAEASHPVPHEARAQDRRAVSRRDDSAAPREPRD
jgi:sulfatase maturation enzyme AslB (radical SAM superfamily)